MQYFYCDVTEPSSITEAASKLRLKWGDPSILINNAGIGKPHTILDTAKEFVSKIFTINIISHFCESLPSFR
jgi:short-subunit dehydrogenase